MSRRTKILIVLALIVVLGLIFLWPRGGYRREVEAYKRQLIARGEKLTVAELAPPPSINPSNGARAFMDLIASYRVPDDYPSTVKMVAPGLAEIGYTNGSANLTSNYAVNYQKMVELRKVLTAPVIEFNLDYSQGMMILLPHLAKLKSATQFSTMTMMQALHANDFAEAQSDLLSAVKLVRLYKNEPLMISGLVRVAMAQITIGATWAALQSNAWTEPQLAELENEWQDMNLFLTAPAAVSMERAIDIEELAKARKDLKLFRSLVDNFLLLNPPINPSAPSPNSGVLDQIKKMLDDIPARLRFWRWRSNGSYQEEMQLLRTHEAALQSTQVIIDSGAFVPAWQEFNQQVSNINLSFPDRTNNVLFGFDNQFFGTYLKRLAISETARRICITAIALKRYHLQHGAYPTNLANLVPKFLPSVPMDFMDGKPLRYRLRPDGDFLLYSVGEDGIDDGGDPRPPASAPKGASHSWMTGRDIVWPRVANPANLEEYRQKYGAITNSP